MQNEIFIFVAFFIYEPNGYLAYNLFIYVSFFPLISLSAHKQLSDNLLILEVLRSADNVSKSLCWLYLHILHWSDQKPAVCRRVIFASL